MGQRKNKKYFLCIFLVLFALIGCGTQKEQIEQNEKREIPILPDNIPKKFLEQRPNYKKYPIYESEIIKEMEEWKWEGEGSFEIEKRKEQKGAWIAYYPVFSSSSYKEEAKKINESLEEYLKSFQETYFEEQWSEMFNKESTVYENVLLYLLTFDVTYDSKDEISIAFDFLVCWKDERRWERQEKGWKDDIFLNPQSQIFYVFVPNGEIFPYQDTTKYAPSFKDEYKDNIILESHEKKVNSYQIERLEEELVNRNGERITWVYPQLIGEGEQIEKINADIKADYEILLQYANGGDGELFPSLPTQNNYCITYNDEQVISILYEYASWYEECNRIQTGRAGFYNAVYDLNTGEKIQYEDLIDSSQVEAFAVLLQQMYPDEHDIEDIFFADKEFYLDDLVYYLRENEISFLGNGDFPYRRFLELYGRNEITIPYVLAKKIKTDHPIWDWLLRTEK